MQNHPPGERSIQEKATALKLKARINGPCLNKG